jgi:EAL domain-containing protein (putative c-di-GMP-specific phosphodiesterase class I)
LEKGYIQPYYQAIVRAFTGKVCACEVLSRWVDPERGLISPVEIIPSLERHHLIHRHDIHIVRCACRDLRHRMDQGRRVVPVSINLSRLDFELCDIFQEVEDALAAHGIPRSLVGIEVTESALSGTEEGFRREMERFRGAGYEIWMDDFGSGYSSLNTLKDYTFDVLKIDMDFMRGLEGNRNSRRIVRSVVDMAKRIGVRTLAEGVETREQFDYLRSLGCEMIQGFLFARPMPLDDLDLTQYVGIEDDMERAYLDQVGRVNLLSQTPGEELTSSREQRTKGRPFAIVSWNGRELSYFSANDAYERLLRERGIGSIEEAQAHLDEDWDLLAEIGALDTGNDLALEHSSLRFILGDALHPARLSVVARQRGSVAILVSPQG